MTWLNDNGAAIQALATVVLVVITYLYVHHTRKLVELSQPSPHLVLVPVRHSDWLAAEIANVGRAPAIELTVHVHYEADEEWDYTVTHGPILMREGDEPVRLTFEFPRSFEDASNEALRREQRPDEGFNRGSNFFQHVQRITADAEYIDPATRSTVKKRIGEVDNLMAIHSQLGGAWRR